MSDPSTFAECVGVLETQLTLARQMYPHAMLRVVHAAGPRGYPTVVRLAAIVPDAHALEAWAICKAWSGLAIELPRYFPQLDFGHWRDSWHVALSVSDVSPDLYSEGSKAEHVA